MFVAELVVLCALIVGGQQRVVSTLCFFLALNVCFAVFPLLTADCLPVAILALGQQVHGARARVALATLAALSSRVHGCQQCTGWYSTVYTCSVQGRSLSSGAALLASSSSSSSF